MKIEAIRNLLSQDRVKLWSLQEVGAWELALQRGELRADGRRAFAEFRPAYHWMIEQMNVRIPNYPGCYPVWAWAEKPDMRYKFHAPSGTPLVRIHFELPLGQVLLSCFSSWHCVLEDDYCASSEKAYNEYHRKLANIRVQKKIGWPTYGMALVPNMQKRNSWQRIFDFEWLAKNPEWHGEEIYLQATMAAIPLDSVISVEHFVAR